MDGPVTELSRTVFEEDWSKGLSWTNNFSVLKIHYRVWYCSYTQIYRFLCCFFGFWLDFSDTLFLILHVWHFILVSNPSIVCDFCQKLINFEISKNIRDTTSLFGYSRILSVYSLSPSGFTGFPDHHWSWDLRFNDFQTSDWSLALNPVIWLVDFEVLL